MQKKEFRGTGVAVVTPFNDRGEVDFSALENLVDFLIEGGVDYLVVLGTTAETATLSEKEQKAVAECIFEKNEQKAVAECIFEKNAGRVPLVIGAGGNNTATIIEKVQSTFYKKFDALLIATPYYNKPNQNGLYQHYKAIAQATEQPIILYNVPGRTGVNMTAETTLRLANEFSHIIAIKEASGNLEQINRIICEKPQHFEVISGDDGLTLPMLSIFEVISGDDGLTLPMLSIGAIGVISVLANALPKEMSEMVNAGLAYEYEKAQLLHNQLFALSQAIFEEGNPTGIKSLMSHKGLLQNNLRLPLISASEGLDCKLRRLLNA